MDDEVQGWQLAPSVRRTLGLEEAARAMRTRDLGRAVSSLEELLDLDPDDTTVLEQLCSVLLAGRDVIVAREALGMLLHHTPDDPNRWGQLALCHLECCDLPEAIEAAQQALQLRPDHAASCFVMGLCHEQLGDQNEAGVWFERAFHAHPVLYPLPMPITAAFGREVLQEALQHLPDDVRTLWQDVPLELHRFPDIGTLTEAVPPLSPRVAALFTHGSAADDEADTGLDGDSPAASDDDAGPAPVLKVFLGNLAHAPDVQAAADELAEALIYEAEAWSGAMDEAPPNEEAP